MLLFLYGLELAIPSEATLVYFIPGPSGLSTWGTQAFNMFLTWGPK